MGFDILSDRVNQQVAQQGQYVHIGRELKLFEKGANRLAVEPGRDAVGETASLTLTIHTDEVGACEIQCAHLAGMLIAR